ncbi:hypothetical protein [Larkinella soli]|uniref:hypothetical protein n=1 Tax=Larkinella soli TaxID=1770527 RepID=UPI000FFC51BC|nr:hypothetical protein [Larkinella soli]
MTHRYVRMLFVLLVLGVGACSKYEERAWEPRPTPNPNETPGTGQPNPTEKPTHLDNGVVRVEVDLDLGGAIRRIASSTAKVNLVNTWDPGRYVQASFYSGPNPYTPNGKQPHPLWKDTGWNPILAGDSFGNRSQVLDWSNNGQEIYVKTKPMLWPYDNEPAECTIETWIRVEGNAIRVKHRLINNRTDTTQYSARPQELPAVFLNAPYHQIITYTGNKPFTSDAVLKTESRSVNQIYGGIGLAATENWVALVDNAGFGLGLWKKNNYYFQAGAFGTAYTGNQYDFTSCYVTSTAYEVLDHNIRYEYEYALILGTVDQIRQFVYKQARPDPIPDYRFVSDRQSWWYYQGADRGFPIKNELDIPLDKGNFLLIGPVGYWQAADVPKLYVKGAFKTDAGQARIRWKKPGDPEYLSTNYLDFPIVGDGVYRTYEIDLTKAPGWQGTLSQLGFEPAVAEKGGPGKYARIQSISARP